MWSLGVILYILLCGSPPFYGNTEVDTLNMVRKAKYSLEGSTWEYVSESAKDLIRKLMEKDPKQRLSAEEALAHEWICNQQEDIPLSPSVVDSMNRFVQMERLKREALGFIARTSGRDEARHLSKIFRKFATNDRLSFEDANRALRGRTKQLGVSLFAELDLDHDGSISCDEFVAAAMKRDIFEQEEKLHAAFQHFDVDGDGMLSAEDLKQHLGDRGDISAMIKRLDVDGNGKLDMAEFIKMMRDD